MRVLVRAAFVLLAVGYCIALVLTSLLAQQHRRGHEQELDLPRQQNEYPISVKGFSPCTSRVAKKANVAVVTPKSSVHSPPRPPSKWTCSEQGIFVVGAEHSGTTLVLRLIAKHPQIHAVNLQRETDVFFKQSTASTAQGLELFKTKCEEARNKRRYVEKTPRHILKLKEILALESDARVVVVMRDGRDVVASYRARWGNPETVSFEELLNKWVEFNAAAVPFLNDPRVFVVRYESLVKDTDAALKALFHFLGDDNVDTAELQNYNRQPDGAKKPPDESDGLNHAKLRNWQLHQPVFDNRERWRRPSDGLTRKEAEEACLHCAFQTMLLELGYDPTEMCTEAAV